MHTSLLRRLYFSLLPMTLSARKATGSHYARLGFVGREGPRKNYQHVFSLRFACRDYVEQTPSHGKRQGVARNVRMRCAYEVCTHRLLPFLLSNHTFSMHAGYISSLPNHTYAARLVISIDGTNLGAHSWSQFKTILCAF